MRVEDSSGAGYILGYDPRELERLEAQAAAWAAATRRALAAVAVPRGARCLDVGCGTGSVMRMLADLAGPSGRIVGADTNVELGTLTAARLNAGGPAIYEFLPLDIARDDLAVEAEYDVVFARLLLCHVTDPAGVLRRLWARVAPGGVLLVQDYDQLVARAVPENAAAREGLRCVAAAFTLTGRSAGIGTELPAHFIGAGIGPPDGIDVYGQIVSARVGGEMLCGVLRSLLPIIDAKGIAPRERLEETIAAIEALAADARTTVRIPDMVATWKRKPAPPLA